MQDFAGWRVGRRDGQKDRSGCGIAGGGAVIDDLVLKRMANRTARAGHTKRRAVVIGVPHLLHRAVLDHQERTYRRLEEHGREDEEQ